jgi:hypothetical protein
MASGRLELGAAVIEMGSIDRFGRAGVAVLATISTPPGGRSSLRALQFC